MRAYAVALFALVLIPAAGATSAPNPCRLLTSSEVAAHLGGGVQSRARINNGYGCRWTVSNQGAQRTLELGVWASDRSRFELGAKVVPQRVRVRGIGQEAYASNVIPPYLLVWKNGIALRVDTSLRQDPTQAEQALARLAVSRFPKAS